MPSKTDLDILLICVGLFVIIIVAMMFSTDGLSPYNARDGKSLSQYPYEGFNSAMEYFYNRNVHPATPTTPAFVANSSNSAIAPSNYVDVPVNATPITKEGFEGLKNGEYDTEQRIEDIIYSSAGPDCNGKGFGLTTSKGFLCLSDKDIKLLTSRGGNT